jgi:hypothetical protein
MIRMSTHLRSLLVPSTMRIPGTELSPEFERVLRLLGPLARDRGLPADSNGLNTALLLYALLQLPDTAAHAYLGDLDLALRAWSGECQTCRAT